MSQKLSRRELLKLLGAATGAVALSSLPNKWVTPIVEFGALPAHAQGSSIATLSGYIYSCATGTSPSAPRVIQAPSTNGCTIPPAGSPVSGATVKLQNTNIMTTTDQNGHYSLQVPSGSPCLVVTIGAIPSTVCVNNVPPGASVCLSVIFGSCGG